MKQYLLAFTITTSLAAQSFAPNAKPFAKPPIKNCPANEVYTNCHNSCTEKKCPIKNGPLVKCFLSCSQGCTCRPGYLRNNKGVCVKPRECPPLYQGRKPTNENPCNLIDCRSGLVCQLQNGKPVCVAVNPCSTVRCRSGYVCKEVSKRAKCVSAPPRLTCDNVRCGMNTFCAMVRSFSCNSPSCEVPTCIESNQCAVTLCIAGSQCILRQVQCFAPPCNPIAECVRN